MDDAALLVLGLAAAGYGYLLYVNWTKGKTGFVFFGLLGYVFVPWALATTVLGASRVAKPGSRWFNRYAPGSDEEAKAIARFPKEAAKSGYEDDQIGKAAVAHGID